MQIHMVRNEAGVDEWTIVELQGSLETSGHSLDGKILGNLCWRKDTKEAILIIGNHLLEGKFTQLEKPLLVAVPNADDQSYVVNAVIRRKLLFKLRPKPIVTKGLSGHMLISK
ncbi:hypothetical protein WR25_11409 [Diploscapter pachys]|uniref:Chromosome transmission fidelity protein 8 homolog n=1 Tax=Diploscapter pachys TaxID=2018661 RepID=A0A2A2JS39_9BILA|nr:hypothetical protein WR25_11409 [Diploscapter pachys]